MIPSAPILSCEEARAWEATLFSGDEAKEWTAMQRAGRAIARAVRRDFEEIGGFPPNARVLVLAGKGNNAGDAFIAAQALLERFPAARADVVFAFGERALRPLAARAWQTALGLQPQRWTRVPPPAIAAKYDLCLDGIFGFQFRPPAEPRLTALLEHVNALPIRLRAAVDLPSADLFRADFTYATGSVKTPVIDAENAGRVRYLDLGFFNDAGAGDADPGQPGAATPVAMRDATARVLTSAVLAPLAALRPARCDKRSYGQLFVVGGSRSFPGAILMTVLGALRSGAGLVTAFVPESVAAAFAARAPEAMWVGWPETPAGGLALEGERLLRERFARADALVLGPGLGREPETLALVQSIVANSPIPLVLDADAQQPEIVRAGQTPRIVTPHAGEFKRIAGEKPLREFAQETGATIVLKGPVTRIVSGGRSPSRPAKEADSRPAGTRAAAETAVVYHSFFGGPVLARGGSGDVLSGIIGAQLAQSPGDPLVAAARGVVWHGLAAEALARAHGQVAVHTTQLLDFLPAVLRSEGGESGGFRGTSFDDARAPASGIPAPS